MSENNAILTAAERRKEQKKQAREALKRKKEVARLKKEHKARAKVVPNEDRALICTPDKATMSDASIIVGVALRGLVAAVATLGLVLFVCDALAFSGEGGAGISLSLLSLHVFLICAALSAIFMGNLPVKLGGAAVFCATCALSLFIPTPTKVYHALIAAFNCAIDRLVSAGFLAMGEYRLAPPATDIANEELIFTAAVIFATLAALVYVPSLIRRIRLLPPLLLTAGTLIPVFIYNLTRENWGVVLVIASVAAMVVMLLYDKLYAKPQKRGLYDESITLCAPEDEPPLPQKLAERLRSSAERKAARRAEKERRRAEKESATVSLDDELSDYFGSSPRRAKKKKTVRTSASADEKKRQKAELRTYVSHKKRIRDAKSAAGGFAGAGALALAVLILLLPALSVSGRFTAIESIDNTLQYYRDYVTALLVGDSPALDALAYDAETQMFLPRDTEATPQTYTKLPIMRVYTNVGYNTYLREWIGVDYAEGKWHTVNSADSLLVDYREKFGTGYDPAETVKKNFYTYFAPELLDFDLRMAQVNGKLDVALTKIAIERYNLATMNLYLPAYTLREFNPTVEINGKTYSALMPLAAAEPSGTTYANYFDGVYTSFAVRESNEAFAAVALLTNMRSRTFGEELAARISALNGFRNSIGKGATTLLGNEYPYLLTLADGSKMRYKTYLVDGVKYVAYFDGFEEHNYHRDESGALVASPSAPALPKEVEYLELMTYAERSYYDNMFRALDEYTVFVKDAYSKPAEGEVFSELLQKIATEAGVDVKLAASANAYHVKNGTLVSAVTDSAAYLERHRLTMAIVDYLVENYTYTKAPTVTESETYGVEKFLTETKEGYCVQFASALALLLREAGIPARYTEGYIASDFTRVNADDGAYYTDVLDEYKHAWVEVWFDGVGWMQYEATPEYYDSAYKPVYNPSGGSQGGDTEIPIPTPPEPKPPVNDEPDTPPPSQIIDEEQDEARRRLIAKIVTAALITLAVLTVFFLIIFIVVRSARKAAAHRKRLLDKLASAKDGEPPTREEVREVADMLFLLLDECGLAPAAGQLGDDLAATLAEDLDGVLSKAVREEGLTEYQAEHARLGERELKRVFAAIAAAEFGYGAPPEDVHLIARLYRRLYAHVYRKKVSAFRRARLYFVQRRI